jgi:hypothetical protein
MSKKEMMEEGGFDDLKAIAAAQATIDSWSNESRVIAIRASTHDPALPPNWSHLGPVPSSGGVSHSIRLTLPGYKSCKISYTDTPSKYSNIYVGTYEEALVKAWAHIPVPKPVRKPVPKPVRKPVRKP